MAETLLDQAREVLAIEAQALGTLSGSLDQNFVDASILFPR